MMFGRRGRVRGVGVRGSDYVRVEEEEVMMCGSMRDDVWEDERGMMFGRMNEGCLGR